MSETDLTTELTTDASGYDERRTVKGGHLVFGLILLGIAGIWALEASGTVDWGDSKYAFPIVLVGAGVLGLVATVVVTSRRRTAPPPVVPTPPSIDRTVRTEPAEPTTDSTAEPITDPTEPTTELAEEDES